MRYGVKMWRKSNEVKQIFERKISSIENDYKRAYFKLPDIQFSPFPILLYSLAHLDYFSGLWVGWNDIKHRKSTDSVTNQTDRMLFFSVKYFNYPEKETRVMINMFRHKLIHTGDPLVLYREDKKAYTWAIYSKSDQHMKISYEDDNYRLHFGIGNFIKDLRNAIFGEGKYFEQLQTDYDLQDNCLRCLKEISSTTIKL